MFLDNVSLTKKYPHWLAYADAIYSPDITPDKVLKMLKTEIHFKNRKDIVKRLYGRFNKLRYTFEKARLYKGIPQLSDVSVPDISKLSWDMLLSQHPEIVDKEDYIYALLRKELENARRSYVVGLLHGRYCTLRRKREIKEMEEYRARIRENY